MDQQEINKKIVSLKIHWRALFNVIKKIIKFTFVLALIVGISYVVYRFWLSNDSVNHERILMYIERLQWVILIIVVYLLFRPWLPNVHDYFIKKINTNGISFDTRVQAQIEDIDAIDSSTFDLSTVIGRQKALENFELKYNLEKFYRIIFGTQIKALQLLSLYPDGLTIDGLQAIYDEHESLTNMPFDSIFSFMGYLTNARIVLFDNGRFSITVVGLTFIDYLVQEGISDPAKRPW